MNDKGETVSPMVDIDEAQINIWDMKARSAVEVRPCDSFEAEFCSGIHAVTYYQYKNRLGKWANIANALPKEKYRLILLEYSSNDVVISTDMEIIINQCNILFTANPSEFRQKADNGTLANIQKEFHEKKKSLAPCSFAKPIERYSLECSSYLYDTGLRENRISYDMTLMAMTYASLANRRVNACDRHVMLWFCLILPIITDNYSENDIIQFVRLIREKHLASLSDEKVTKLTQALVYSKIGKGPDTIENRIFHDARLAARKIVLFKDIADSQFESEIFKNIIHEDLMLPNEYAARIKYGPEIE